MVNGISEIANMLNERHLQAVEEFRERLKNNPPYIPYLRDVRSVEWDIDYCKRAVQTLSDYPEDLTKYSEILAELIEHKEKIRERTIDEKKIKAYYPPEGSIKHIGKCAGFPERHCGLSLFSWSANTDEQLSAINSVNSWCLRQAEGVNGQSILLYGPPGTGKTHLACAAGAFFGMIHGYQSVVYSNAADIVRTVRDSYDDGSNITERQAFHKFTNPALLIMDEVGVGKDSDFSRETLHTVIAKRYDKRLPTIFVTNSNAKDFRAAIMERAWDRLQEDGAIHIKMAWESFRTTPRSGESRFVCPYPPISSAPKVEESDTPF